jgi:hypothetical protein
MLTSKRDEEEERNSSRLLLTYKLTMAIKAGVKAGAKK